MRDFVLVMAYRESKDKFLLIEKNRPEFQKGRYNLIGGKVERGETYTDAAIRELEEESGILTDNIEFNGIIFGSWGVIECFSTNIRDSKINQPENETELVFDTTWEDVREDNKLMPNLKVVIPLMMAGSKNWRICCEGDTESAGLHKIFIVT